MPDTSPTQPARSAAPATLRPAEKDRPGPVRGGRALEIDWPRSLGYFGGIAAAVGVGLIEPPAGLFIAAVPFLRMLGVPCLPDRARFVAQVFEGIAKAAGGDSEGIVRIVGPEGASGEPLEGGG